MTINFYLKEQGFINDMKVLKQVCECVSESEVKSLAKFMKISSGQFTPYNSNNVTINLKMKEFTFVGLFIMLMGP